MFSENSGLFTAIIIISLIFLIICLSLIFIVVLYNQRRRLHVEEKKEMNQKFEAELLQTHLEVQEQTMQTIAADLHDNIGQLLSLTALTLNSIEIQQQKKAEKKVGDSLSLVNKSIKELRELAKLLQGEQLVASGLGHALQQEFDWLKKTGAYQLQFNNQLIDLKINSPNKDLIVLRLLQEIFNNIIKHARAKHIAIDAHLTNDILHLNVKEDGIGFDYEIVKKENHGMGLQSLQKRIVMINGTIDIYSEPKLGTTITIEIPYP
jgi:signal transduction histidine kinase